MTTGTRMPVSIVIGSLASGMSKEDVMREYELTKEQLGCNAIAVKIGNTNRQFTQVRSGYAKSNS